jgi:hypothetical protein
MKLWNTDGLEIERPADVFNNSDERGKIESFINMVQNSLRNKDREMN